MLETTQSAQNAYSKINVTFDLLICTLISENQDLEKSRSASNLRKILGPANLDFFLAHWSATVMTPLRRINKPRNDLRRLKANETFI